MMGTNKLASSFNHISFFCKYNTQTFLFYILCYPWFMYKGMVGGIKYWFLKKLIKEYKYYKLYIGSI